MSYPRICVEQVEKGGFLVVRYMPFFRSRGIAATLVTDVYRGGFCFDNFGMGIEGDSDMFEKDEPIVRLPDEFRPPIRNDVVYSVGGVYIPKNGMSVLRQLSNDANYQRSLKTFGSPEVLSTENLLQILSEQN